MDIAISTAISVSVTLLVTFLFNFLIGLPKKWKAQKDADKKRWDQLDTDNSSRDDKITLLDEQIKKLQKCNEENNKEQEDLKVTDNKILETCKKIQEAVDANRKILNDRLNHLEQREKNSLRAKILAEYRLFTDDVKNPMLAWSEMEHHAFFALIHDYENLGGNDYVHSVVLPAMNELDVVPMSDTKTLEKLYHSRNK